MAENRWQIIIGAGVLLLMLLAGSFSLGVYFGRHGLSQEGLQYQPAQQNPQAPPPEREPQNQPAGIPEGKPNLLGRLRQVTPKGIELATENGIRFVAIDEETKFLDNAGNPLSGSDLKPGDILVIFGDFSMNEGQQLLAFTIVRRQQRPTPQP